MLFLIKIGFFTISFWDALDVLIVGYLLFQLYKLLRGSLGFNIFLGLVFIFCVWWVVAALRMPLLSSLLGQFISVGMIALLVLFQPELRRFLLYLGQGSFRSRFTFLDRLLRREIDSHDPAKEHRIREIVRAAEQMADTKTGALLIFSNQTNLEGLYSSGVMLNADITTELLLSIFFKDSPMHDGATFLTNGKVVAASCVLPVSENPNIPQKLGLRHRAAVGITEGTDLIAFIISEETGKISYARSGQLTQDVGTDWMYNILRKVMI